MDRPEKFTTFVLGTFVFAYYLLLAVQIWRVWRRTGRCPVVAFTRPKVADVLHAAAALVGPLPVLAWAWCPPCLSRSAIAPLENWPARMLGLLALCAGLSIGYLSVLELGDGWRIGIEEESPVELVTTGVYGSIRHPVYSSVLLGLFGVLLMAPNWIFAGLWALAALGAAALSRREERGLERRLGAAYAEYRRKTGRFLP